MNNNKLALAICSVTASALFLSGCFSSSNSSNNDTGPDVARVHDSREFTVVADLSFDGTAEGLNEAALAAERFWGTYEGIQGQAGYTVEVPQHWNGQLIMWTRGYGGEEAALTRVLPSVAFRNTAIANGYAWAASTYSANFYDVRAAIEDTNKLALELEDLLFNNHGYQIPGGEGITQRLIAGGSLGGHTAAAAVEAETLARARHKVEYAGAMPLCQAEQNQFDWLGDYNRVAQHLAGLGDEPHENFQELRDLILAELFIFNSEGVNTWVEKPGAGEQLKAIAMNLTGGPRPVFDQGFYYGNTGVFQQIVLGSGGADGTIEGILAANFYDNQDRVYRWEEGDMTPAEEAFNNAVSRVSADPDANPEREDGVRWIPLVEGNFSVPVLTMHTLGDFYVPFVHQQLYLEGATVHGNEDRLVQRAIRAPGHCDFSSAEISRTLQDFLDWVNEGIKPAGDAVDRETIAAADYGCVYTENAEQAATRMFFGVPACPVE